jgi:hypothetical protein
MLSFFVPQFLALWDHRGDAKMKQDREDVKKRRHRRAESAQSELSVTTQNSSFAISEDDDFDEVIIAQPIFTFETDEISNMLYPPNTPLNGRRVSAVDAFVLEKDRSTRSGSTRKYSLPGGRTPEAV